MSNANKDRKLSQNAAGQRVIHPGEIIMGVILSVSAEGVYVDYDGNPTSEKLLAISTIPIVEKQIGREVALLFSNGDLTKPILMGVVFNALEEAIVQSEEESQLPLEPLNNIKVSTDDDRMFLEAKKEITIKCGKSSITLKEDGKILLRGTYLSSRSTGVNRILGGSVLLN